MLDKLKLLLGLKEADNDDLLLYLIESVSARLENLVGASPVPAELDYIVLEVCVVRYNRIGSEGTESHTVEGESLTFSGNEFDNYKDEIQAYIDKQDQLSRGKVRFL